jgi:phenylalanine-4-hydroxylase
MSPDFGESGNKIEALHTTLFITRVYWYGILYQQLVDMVELIWS